MSPAPSPAHIHYLRPPDDERVFVQDLVLDTDEVKVTLARDVAIETPVRIDGRIVLELGSDAVWFTFPGRWHDIGRFHRADGTFTGFYANILTPPVFEKDGRVWRTTDLFLDVWLEPDGALRVLDRDQLEQATREGWVGAERAERARAEVRRIRADHKASLWPPAVVEEWTLARALQAAKGATDSGAEEDRPPKEQRGDPDPKERGSAV